MSLTETQIKSFKPDDKDYKKADGKGLSLVITVTGSKRWLYSYRYNGKPKSLSLGIYPEISLKTAREKLDEARKLLASGVDPSAQRKAAKLAQTGEVINSFKAITLEWLAIKKEEWVPSHFSKIDARMKNDVLPWLGPMPITEIKAPDILSVLKRIQSRNAIETAHRARETIGQIFRYAIASGRAEYNPAPNLIGALKKPKPKHMAAIIEPLEVGALLRQINGYTGTFTVRCALQLAPLLFVRPGEMRQAEWKDINFETAEWRFNASKTYQAHIVPLSRQAIEILKEIQPYSGHGKYVFPSPRTDERPMSSNAVLSAFRRMGIDKEDMSGHGFRATAKTLLLERLKYQESMVDLQLAHRVKDPNGGAYHRAKFLDDRKIMMQHWADYLDNLHEGRDVVPPAAQYSQDQAA